MKQTAKLFGVAAAAVSLSFLVSTALADGLRVSGGSGNSFHGSGSVRGSGRGGSWGGYHSGGFSGGYRGGGSWGGYHGGYYGGYHRRNWGGGGCYPWGVSFDYISSPAPYDYYYYDCPPPPVYDYSPPAVYSAPPPALAPPAVQQPQPNPQGNAGQPTGLADVKALAKAGLNDEVIISQIRNTRTVYYLSAAEIIDLKKSGVSEKVIDSMINALNFYSPSSAPRH